MRKKALAFAAGSLLVVILAGCSTPLPPLKAKDVSLTTTVDQATDLLIGDSVIVTSVGELAHKRKDHTRLAIQQSTDGKVWTDVSVFSEKSSKLSAEKTVKITKAGALQLRSELRFAAKGAKAIATSSPVSIASFDIKQLIRDLYYNETQAYAQSTAAGIAFNAANNYPGEYDTASASYQSGASTLQSVNLVRAAVPDLTTISPAPTWIEPASSCHAASTIPPKGKTFIVTISESDSTDEFGGSPQNADIHVTLLGGKVYFYQPFCG